jgi:hypothetical protein
MTYFCLHFDSYHGILLSPEEGRMPRISPYHIVLSPDEESALLTVASKYTSPYWSVVRAKAILLAAQGMSNEAIGERLSMPRQIVSKWRKRFFEERLDGLCDLPRQGRPASFPPGGGGGGQSLGL